MLFPSWSIAVPDPLLQRELSEELGIHPITAQIMINRGLTDPSDVREHINPLLKSLPDPFLLPDMAKAVERIVRAIRDGERIAVFGDYDVDGITSSALMYRFFKSIGVMVKVHIPNRLREGYGLNVDALQKLCDEGIDLLITVDNGTRSAAEVEIARGLGLDIVVTDHHEVEGELPNAVAVVNPKRAESDYPYRSIAGCGVAFMLLMALRKELRHLDMLPSPEPNLKEFLDLVAIGTIADIVPLTGVNRTLAKFGMMRMVEDPRPGIGALLDVSGLNDSSRGLSAGQVAFRIAPRLNAAGRMGDAAPALNCLVTDDRAEADRLARLLDRTNAERQRLEERILREARDVLENDVRNASRAALTVASSRWHPGVIGIVASKLAETTEKPCAVIACEGGVGRGSVRSAGGINVVDALSQASDLLDRFGGHAQAAGFTVDARRIDELRERFSSACMILAPEAPTRELVIDAEISTACITDRLIDELGNLEPYGMGNPEPIFCSSDLEVMDKVVVGGSHLRLRVSDGHNHFNAIGFGMATMEDRIGHESMLAFIPQHNFYNGVRSIQLKVKGILLK